MKKFLFLLLAGVLALGAFTACSASSSGGGGSSVDEPQIESVTLENATYTKGDILVTALRVNAKSTDGGEISYQWYKDDKPIEGETAKSYKPDTSVAGVFDYNCIVTNTKNGKSASVDTDYARITVQTTGGKTTEAEEPVITTQPTGASYNQNDTSVKALTVAATANGTLSYQWYKDGAAISGATSASYTPAVTQTGSASYYVEVTNTLDGETKTVKSNTVTITVIDPSKTNVAAPKITANPSNASYTVGDAATELSVTASALASSNNELDGSLTFQWYKDGTAISGATDAKYKPDTTTAGTYSYYVIVTSTNNSATGTKVLTATSNTATITVSAKKASAPIITTQPTGASYQKGATAIALKVVASVTDSGTLSYQWYDTNNKAISGATSATYTPSTSTVGTFHYSVVVTNNLNGTTAQTVSAEAEIVISDVKLVDAEEPTISKIAATKTEYSVNNSVTITVTASVSDGGTLSYQWYKDGTAISGATGSTYKSAETSTGKYSYHVVVTNTNTKATGVQTKAKTSSTVQITVTPEEATEADGTFGFDFN